MAILAPSRDRSLFVQVQLITDPNQCDAGNLCIDYKDDVLYVYAGKAANNIGGVASYLNQAQSQGF